jgi:hypothetical protein
MDHGTGVGETRKRRAWVQSLRIAGYLFFVYATTYFIMMYPGDPAYDPVTWNVAYDSSYMFSPWSNHPRIVSLSLPNSCWANHVFWPMDCLVQPWLKPCDQAVREQRLREKLQ